MLKPASIGTPPDLPPRPVTMDRSARSFMSITRFQTTDRGSSPRVDLVEAIALSIKALSKLFAFSTAEKSPVKCRLMSSIGTTCARPPPAAPPFIPNTGPSDGSRSAAAARTPMRFSPSVSPTVVVVLPSPAGVGERAVTSTSRAFSICSSRSSSSGSFALYRP